MPSKSVFVARIDKSTCSAPLQVLERAGRLIVFCVVLAAPLSCGDDHGCHLSNSDGNWNEFGFDAAVEEPARCPVGVQVAGANITFNASVFGPIDLLFDETLTETIYNGNAAVVAQIISSWYQNIDNQGESDPFGSYPVGTAIGDDQAYSIAAMNNALTAVGVVDLPYHIGIEANVPGPGSDPVGAGGLFKDSAAIGPTPYTYAWRRNDTPITGQSGASYTYTPTKTGAFTVSGVAIDKNGKRDSMTLNSFATFSVTINGPTAVKTPGGTCNWTAVATGGAAPVSYLWTWDSHSAGTGTSLSEDVETSPHTLDIQLTDAHGNVASARQTISLTSNGLACVQ